MSNAQPTFAIHSGDCLDVLRTLPDESVNLIVTSPPYAMQRRDTYGGIPPNEYSEWFLPRADELRRVLRKDGSFILNIWEHVADGQRHPYVLRLVLDMIDSGWKWIEEYIWRKINPVPGKTTLRVRDCWEHLYHFGRTTSLRIFTEAVDVPARWKPENRRNLAGPRSTNGSGLSGTRVQRRVRTHGSNFGTNDERMAGQAVAMAHNVIETTVGGTNTAHPGAFPRAIPEFFIKLFTLSGDVVLDPFAGSGTTCLAAYAMRRSAIGIEIVPDYVTMIREAKSRLQLELMYWQKARMRPTVQTPS